METIIDIELNLFAQQLKPLMEQRYNGEITIKFVDGEPEIVEEQQ